MKLLNKINGSEGENKKSPGQPHVLSQVFDALQQDIHQWKFGRHFILPVFDELS